MRRVLVRLVTVAALVGTALLAPTAGSAPTDTARAADLNYFDPGNIVSDAVFYDFLSMSTVDVQNFLNSKGTNCSAGALCLKNYVVTTTDRAADSLCQGYAGAPNESAAVIITKVAASCGVSPRVLLVVLQKEQGLVTATSPTQHQYDRATGYACPDSANGACDPAYVGLENQLYWSAWQYDMYRAQPYSYNFLAGQNNTIAWSPDPSCGSSVVYIADQATAGLYDYTPYRPNQAALNAGYGSGDACSAYGNRNFWNYFTDWFGSTQSAGGSAIYSFYESQGGSGGRLGPPVRGFVCGLRDGGCFQVFTMGSIYWSPSTGAHFVMGDIGASWASRGWETGPLGYPVGETNCGLAHGGCFQDFQGGSLYWSAATGAHTIAGQIRALWGTTGWEGGWLGYPTSDQFCGLTGGGCFNHFQGGSIYSSPTTGVHAVNVYIRDKWASLGWETGTLGYPVADQLCGLAAGGCRQDFQGGSMYWSPASGAAYTRGNVQATWELDHTQDGVLGYPVTDVACGLVGGGCSEAFQHGLIYWSPGSGGHMVRGDVGAAWLAERGPNGPLGYPLGEVDCTLAAGGCRQVFQGGNLYWTAASGGHFVRGIIDGKWESLSAQDGALGYPLTDEICGLRNGGCFNHFQRGSIYWTPATGAHPVSGPIRDAWTGQGWETGSWGYPIGDPTTSGSLTTQRFQGGTATYDTTTGRVTFG